MIYRMKNELERTPIEDCMGRNGTVWMRELLTGQREIMRRGRTYVCHTLNPGVSIGIHTHEGEMETMIIIREKTVHTINGWDQYLEGRDIVAVQPGDSHGIAQARNEPLVLVAQVLFAQMQEL